MKAVTRLSIVLLILLSLFFISTTILQAQTEPDNQVPPRDSDSPAGEEESMPTTSGSEMFKEETSPTPQVLKAPPFNNGLELAIIAYEDVPAGAIAFDETTNPCGSDMVRTINVPDSFTISDVDFGFTADHTFRGDVRVIVQSPATTQVEVISLNGGDGDDNYDLLLDDASANPIDDGNIDNTGAPYYDRTVQPNNVLAGFAGENSAGTWTIFICDNAGGDSGAYHRSQLILHPAALSCNADEIAGTVYRDYDATGTQDLGEPGFAGVTVTAYDSTNTAVMTTTSTADGSYLLTGLIAATPYRLEFAWSESFLAPGSAGGTNTQFVNSGTCNADFNLNNPADYCQVDPLLGTSCYTLFEQSTQTATVLISFDYTAGCTDGNLDGACDNVAESYDTPSYTPLAQSLDVGATWGMAYHRGTDNLYVSSFMKRHSGFRNFGDTGIIYEVQDASTTPTPVVYANFDTLGIDTGTDPHPSSDFSCGVPASGQNCWFHDPASWDDVGKMGFGDMDISDDDTTLWVVNLFDRTLNSLPAASAPISITNITTYTLPLPGDCPVAATNARPFATAFHDGLVYVGMVCSAETTQLATDLRAYVYSMDPDIGAGSFTQVFNEPLNYPRGEVVDDGTTAVPADWNPWITTFTLLGPAFTNEYGYPQPWFTDIEFDGDQMILGIRDRLADQSAYEAGHTDTTDATLYTGDGAGDILRACPDGSGGWNLENNANCGSLTTSGVSNTEGPGNGEFYYEDHYPAALHDELSLGGLAHIAVSSDVVNTIFDPIFDTAEPFDGGIFWYDNLSGDRTQAYRVYDGPGNNFAKAGGLGDLEAFCSPAPLEVGNRLWCDANNDGIQDPGEAGVGAGINVVLTCGADLPVTGATDANGNYRFTDSDYQAVNGTNMPTLTSCTISVDTTGANGAAIAAACGIPSATPTLPNIEGDATNDAQADLRDSDGVDSGTDASVAFTTGRAGRNNHTFDFGFGQPPPRIDWGDLPDTFDTTSGAGGANHTVSSELRLGNCVDSENDGTPDAFAGETGTGGDNNLLGSTTSSCDAPGDDEDGVTLVTPLIPGAEACVSVAANVPVGTAVLNAWFDFNGDGDFDLDVTDQIVFNRIGGVPIAPTTEGSVPNGSSSQEYCFDVPVGAAFDGGETHMRFRLSSAGGLSFNGAAADGEVEDYWRPLACVGNLVWDDVDGDGVQGGAEPGINGVTTNLVWAGSDGVIGTGDDRTYNTTTANDGLTDGIYNFCGLISDDGSGNANYRIEVPTPPTGYDLTTNDAPAGTDFTDSDGTQPGGLGSTAVGPTFTVPTPIALATAENGTGDNPGTINNFPDAQDDISYDFGFISYDYGDLPDTDSGAGTSYPTTNTDGGEGGPARHALDGITYLGSCVDSESNGQAIATALGDDTNTAGAPGRVDGTCTGGDDEDGVRPASGIGWSDGDGNLIVDVVGSGCLNVWLDWGDGVNPLASGNGTFDLPAEHVISNQAVITGTGQIFTFTLPVGAANNAAWYLRARLTPRDGGGVCTGADTYEGGTPAPNGTARGGEVEDYQVGFTPTAVTLQDLQANANTIPFALVVVGVLLLTLTGLGVNYHHRKRIR